MRIKKKGRELGNSALQGSPGLALSGQGPPGLLPQPAEGGRPAPGPPPHGPHHHVAIGAAAGHLLDQLGGQAAMQCRGARLRVTLLGAPVRVGLGVLLQMGGPIAGGALLLLLVLADR